MSNLKDVVQDIPPSNIWNYDETNLTYDLIDNISKFSKSSIYLTFCDIAERKCLPPYKDKHI